MNDNQVVDEVPNYEDLFADDLHSKVKVVRILMKMGLLSIPELQKNKKNKTLLDMLGRSNPTKDNTEVTKLVLFQRLCQTKHTRLMITLVTGRLPNLSRRRLSDLNNKQ